jgi:hypothetical protein
MTARMLLPGCLLLGLMFGAYGCSDDDGGGDVCEQAFNKMKDCVSKLDCASVTDGSKKAACEFNKSFYAVLSSYAAAMDACKQSGGANCDCTGDNKTEAEKVMSSELDPETCGVEDVQADGGVADQQAADQQVADQQTASE